MVTSTPGTGVDMVRVDVEDERITPSFLYDVIRTLLNTMTLLISNLIEISAQIYN